MPYEIEELLLLVAKLADKYTSKESSSVSYETAQNLMEAVLYCVEEGLGGSGENLPSGGKKPDVSQVYQSGRDIVMEKVYQAKELYETIIRDFEDYKVFNYRNTIIKGMPAFFLKYDPVYAPQDHILTLDYPLIAGNPTQCGINLILPYLRGIVQEQRFLAMFPPRNIRLLLDNMLPENRSLYMDNICYLVLQRATLCVIAEKPVEALELTEEDRQVVYTFLREQGKDNLEEKLTAIIHILLRNMPETKSYFETAAKELAVRLWHSCPV